ncbi:MAG: ornithine cyclodeaminase family protein [Pseudomonadales bacterium]
MNTLIISRSDISEIIARVGLNELMDQTIDAITDACCNPDAETDVRERDGFHYNKPQNGLLEWMPVLRKGQQATIKIIGYHPENPAIFALPTIIGSIGLYDVKTGAMLALADGTLPTALRTAAASAAASQVLAMPDSKVLGIIGCGAQAVTQCHAILRCFPIREILIHDIDSKALTSFHSRVNEFCPTAIKIQTVAADQLVASANILCTCTSIAIGAEPLFSDPAAVLEGLHINAVGSDFAGKFELPLALLQRAAVFPDHRAQCLKEGECQQLDPAAVGSQLSELIRDRDEYTHMQKKITVFDSTGWAVEDQIIMDLLLQHAEHLDIGTQIPLHSFASDPLNPYQR